MPALAITEAGLILADNTTANASTSAHGLLKKLSNTSTEFMNGQGNWATPATGGLTITTAKTASFTAVVNELAAVDMSGASGDFTVTFPASPTHGQTFGYFLARAHATYELIINRNSSNVFGGTTVSGHLLFIPGEYLVWVYDATSSGQGWLLAVDGRKASKCMLRRDAAQALATGDWRNIQFDTNVYDSGGMGSIATNYRITVRRTGIYRVVGRGGFASSMADQKSGWGRISKNGSEWAADPRYASGTSYMIPQVSDDISLAADEYVAWDMYHDVGSDQNTGTGEGYKPRLMVYELLG